MCIRDSMETEAGGRPTRKLKAAWALANRLHAEGPSKPARSKPPPPPAPPAKVAAPAADPPTVDTSVPPTTEASAPPTVDASDPPDFSSMGVSQLKQWLSGRGVDYSCCVERSEIEELCQAEEFLNSTTHVTELD
eukprot:TRINITY_DN52858_c0_g2_i1.p1 TRINITY_DN52858_c0_g2~~TRINITY_DN52858_c0_g2_i1.p1  ORF type:complete len:135 (+),score=36.42 TRINITY_DN52858_c0_g2_i1:97-501(+)